MNLTVDFYLDHHGHPLPRLIENRCAVFENSRGVVNVINDKIPVLLGCLLAVRYVEKWIERLQEGGAFSVSEQALFEQALFRAKRQDETATLGMQSKKQVACKVLSGNTGIMPSWMMVSMVNETLPYGHGLYIYHVHQFEAAFGNCWVDICIPPPTPKHWL